MRKLLVLLIALTFLVGATTLAYGAASATGVGGGNSLGKIKTYTSINTGGAYTSENISTSTIIPGKCEVVGWSCNIYTTDYEGKFDIRDAASTTTASDSYIIAENEATNTIPVLNMLPEGIEVARGITVNQGPQTVVTIYYRQVRP